MQKKILLLFIYISLCFSCQKGMNVSKETPQVVRINFAYTPYTLDPRKTTDPITTVTNHMFYEKLTRLEPDGTIQPALAERIEISKDQKTYTFFLKKSVWSDGSPLTAYHFEKAWKKALSPEFSSSAAHLLFPIQNAENAKLKKCSIDEVGITALNEQTLLVKLTKRIPYFLKLISHPVYSPIPYDGDEVFYPDADPNKNHPILTNGPFSIKSWKHDNAVIAIKNPHYWNAAEVKLEEIRATIIRDEATAFKLFQLNQSDFIGGMTSLLPMDAIPKLKETGKLHKSPIAGTVLTFFNIHQFPFQNLNIRKAFALAVNKEEIIEHVAQMFDDLAIGPVPPTLKRKDPFPSSIGYCPELASMHFEKGLEELGISKEEFPPITYCFWNSELQHQLALAIQGQWQKVLGINIELKTADLKSQLSKLRSRQFEMAQMAWIAQYDDPMSFLDRFTQSNCCNYSQWNNPLYEELIQTSFYKENEERFLLLSQAEEIIQTEVPNIPIYHYHFIYLKNPRLKGLSISILGDIQFHKAFIE